MPLLLAILAFFSLNAALLSELRSATVNGRSLIPKINIDSNFSLGLIKHETVASIGPRCTFKVQTQN